MECMGCGAMYAPPRMHCDRCDGLLRSRYCAASFDPQDTPGMFAFLDWLPCEGDPGSSVGTTVYPSYRFGRRLGLGRLSIAFSGYAPSIGAMNPTGSFKDLEAFPTLLSLRDQGVHALILASAGNTARAFAFAAVQMQFALLMVVPEIAKEQLWLPCPADDRVQVILLEGCNDYAMAIQVAGYLGQRLGVANEGGARNVARRDGMGTAILEFARRTGRIPDHYFQAVGSGTGAIAAWEAAERLIQAGVGDRLPRLHLSQNAPFAPIHDAWTLGTGLCPDHDVDGQLARIAQIDALVLANRSPPYAVPGGVHDALAATQGWTYAISNQEARKAASWFAEDEGLSMGPAAAVATASLIQAVRAGRVGADDTVLLHVTGNEIEAVQQVNVRYEIPIAWSVRPEEIRDREIPDGIYSARRP